MRVLFDFACPDGHVSEQLVNSTDLQSECRKCGKLAERVMCAPRSRLNPISGDFQAATDGWNKKRNQHMALERKAVANHGPDAAWDMNRR